MTVLMLDGRDVRAATVMIHEAVDQLTRSSIRAQGYGTDRWLAGYLGYDWQELLEADWLAAWLEGGQRGAYHWETHETEGG
jgi:hypothetical protein